MPLIEEQVPLMSLNLIGSHKKTKILEFWLLEFSDYINDKKFRQKINSEIGGVYNTEQNKKALQWLLSKILLENKNQTWIN